MFICRNILDRTNNPKICHARNEEEARNWCRATSDNFYGVWAWSTEDLKPSEYWVKGRKYKDLNRAYRAKH